MQSTQSLTGGHEYVDAEGRQPFMPNIYKNFDISSNTVCRWLDNKHAMPAHRWAIFGNSRKIKSMLGEAAGTADRSKKGSDE